MTSPVPRSTGRRFQTHWLAMVWFVTTACTALANDPGGGTNGLGADVTLTDNGGSVTLANGTVTATIDKGSGKITSMFYRGYQMVQSGGNIYYSMDGDYGYRDMSSCAYAIKTNTTDIVDVSFRQTWNSSLPYAFDIEAHWVLRRGDSGLYAYALLDHPANYPGTTNVEWRMVWKFPNDLLERVYVDDLRHWQMPSSADIAAAQPTSIAEIVYLTTGVRAGHYDSKYEYSAEYENIGCWGHASSVRNIGAWFVTGNYEYFNDGPTKQDLTLAWDYNVIHFGRNHYTLNDSSITYALANVAWKKIYGPFLLYINYDPAGGDQLWANAKSQVQAEHDAWPYAWLTGNTNYPLADARGAISGRFLATDPLKSSTSTSNAWVGLADPSVDWQFDSVHYEYWVRAAADGSFAIQNIRPGTYTLHAFTDGEMGEFAASNVVVTAGATNTLGDLTWSVPRTGSYLLWEIGVPDRTAREYRHGTSNYYEGFIWNTFANEFPNPIEYNIGASDWSQNLNFVHNSYTVNGARNPWKWRLNFLLSDVPAGGNATLNLAFASANSATLNLYVNNEASPFVTITPPAPPAGGNALLREGIHAKYITQQVAIPVSNLHIGTNTFTLLMNSTGSDGNHFMYDALSLELPGKPPLPANIDLSWNGGLASNLWDLATTANWSSNTVARVFHTGDRVLFDDTGLNTPAINLAGTLQPGSVTIYAMKSFAFTGAGSLAGPMTLAKSGPGSLTIFTTNTYTGATTVSNGTLILNGSLNSSAVTVRGGASVGGTGRLGGGLTVQSGGRMQPGLAQAGTLTVSNSLVESGGVTNFFDLSDDVTGTTKTNDLIRVAGNLNLSGTNVVAVNLLDPRLAVGVYPLWQYSGVLTGGPTNLVVRGTPGKPYALTNLSGIIGLVIISNRPPTNVFWRGGLAANTWDQAITSNWWNGAAADIFAFDDNVTFDDSGSANPAVNVAGDVNPASVLVNATANYTLSGSGDIDGQGGLTKMNSGALTLLTTNDYSGPTVVAGGVLAVGSVANGGSSSPLGSASGDPTNLVLQSGATLRYLGTTIASDRGATLAAGGGTIEVTNPAASLTLSGSLTGSGGLVKTGPGTLVLGGTNDFSGGVLISGGALQIGAGANSGTLGNGNVTNSSLLVFNRADPVTILPIITGSGRVVKSGSGSITLVNANTYSGGTTNMAGTLILSNNAALGTGPLSFTAANGSSVQLADGVTITNAWVIPGSTADVMLDCPAGTATWAGNVSASGGGSFRPGTSSNNGTLIYTGTANIGGANFIVPRGNVVIAANGVISAGGTVCALGRSSSGTGTTLVARDNASLTFGSGLLLGHTSSGSPYPIVLTLQDNATISCSVSNLDLHDSVNASATTVLNLNGGTLSAGGLKKSQTGANQTATIGFNGGTLKADANNASFLPALAGLTANVKAGGVILDDSGFAITIAAPLLHDPALGSTVDGGLTKLGAGTLTLTATNTFTGDTLVNAGTLALSGNGSLPGTQNITVGSGAALDVSQRSDGTLTIIHNAFPGQTLRGQGTIKGNVVIQNLLAPGFATGTYVGTLTFSNDLTFGPGCGVEMDITKSPLTNDVAKVAGKLTFGGALAVAQLDGNPLSAGDSFKLFDAATNSGSFRNVTLPPLPSGLAWETNSLSTNGTITVVPAPPRFGNLSLTSSNVTLNGSGGMATSNFFVLTSTNLALPLSNWTRLLTNQFDGDGNFSVTNTLDANAPQNFYRLQLP